MDTIAGLTPTQLKASIDQAIIKSSKHPTGWGMAVSYNFLNRCWDIELTRSGDTPHYIQIKAGDIWPDMRARIIDTIRRAEGTVESRDTDVCAHDKADSTGKLHRGLLEITGEVLLEEFLLLDPGHSICDARMDYSTYPPLLVLVVDGPQMPVAKKGELIKTVSPEYRTQPRRVLEKSEVFG